MSDNYNADQIQILEGLEAVRKRPVYRQHFFKRPPSPCL